MKISTKGRYALRILVDISLSNKDYVSITELSNNSGISVKYLEQIISKLVKSKILTSQRGVFGGYKLLKSPSECSISQILSATGDLPELAPCLTNKINCDKIKNCKTIGVWDYLSKIICDYLNKITLQDVIDKTYKI